MTTNKKVYITTVLAALFICTFFIFSARAGEPPDAYEPNETVGTARAITAGTYNLNFDMMGDVDYFNITITKGDDIRIGITSTSVLTITLSGPSGTLATVNLPSGGPGSLSHVANYTGNHTIYATGTGIYTLAITIGSSTPATPGYEPMLVISITIVAIAVLIVHVKARSRFRG
ncbi:MAG: hypothetical protein Q6365_008570 [Candidatus Sigynarchaeota archaeon]